MKKNNSRQLDNPSVNTDLKTSLEDHPIIQWLANNNRTLLHIILGLFILFLIGYRFFFGNVFKSETDFIEAENEFVFFQKPDDTSSASKNLAFERIKALLNRHPELHAKYDGLLAQTLLLRGEVQEAEKLSQLAIERTGKENQPEYTDYAVTTLLIAKKEYAEALKKSLALKEDLLKKALANEFPKDSILYALNLYRIGMLQKELGMQKDEQKTWTEWKERSGLKTSKLADAKAFDEKTFKIVDSLITEGNVTLVNYIDTRF